MLDEVQTRELLQKAVDLKGPDYIYVNPRGERATGKMGEMVQCYNYDDKGQPSCIVGHVASWAGVSNEDYADQDGADIFYSLEDSKEQFFTSKAVFGLIAAQEAQDNGKSWGQALHAYDKAIEEYDRYPQD